MVSWALDQTLEMAFVLEAVACALAQAQPRIWNSVQDSHFTNSQHTRKLLDAGVQISMDGRGRALDKYLRDCASPRDARRRISEYLTI